MVNIDELKKWVRKWVAGWTATHFFNKGEYHSTSRGVNSSGHPLVLDHEGQVDPTFIDSAGIIDAATEQTTLEAANRFPLTDSGVLKYVTWTNWLASLVTQTLTWTGTNVFTGALSFSKASGNAYVTITGVAGTLRGIAIFSSSVLRWFVEVNSAAESGSNAGSNFVIRSVTDAGAPLRDDLVITRSNGNWTLGGSLQSPTIVTPTIASFANANHDHEDTAGGGTLATAALADNAVSNAKLRNSGALSVIGRSTNSTGDPADISAVAGGGGVLRESSNTVGFGTIATAGIANNAVTNAKAADMAQNTVKGRVTASTGDPEDLSANNLVAILNTATSALEYLPTTVNSDPEGTVTGAGRVTFQTPFHVDTLANLNAGLTFGGGTDDGADVNINDDDVHTFTPPRTTGILMVWVTSTGGAAQTGIFHFRTVATQSCGLLVGGSQVNATTGALTGTTGTDTEYTVSTSSATGLIYIENRLGGTAAFRYRVWT